MKYLVLYSRANSYDLIKGNYDEGEVACQWIEAESPDEAREKVLKTCVHTEKDGWSSLVFQEDFVKANSQTHIIKEHSSVTYTMEEK